MKKLPKTISEVEFIDTIKKVKNTKHKLAFMLGFYQCMRVSEIVNLKPTDIDKDRGFIHIIAGKGNKDRDIPITPIVRKGLRNLPINLTRQALHNAMKKYFPGHHFHTLRHSGATFYLNEKKMGLRQLQQLLGHSRLDTTTIYTHITPENLKKSMEELW